jgi:hypothetical protein
VKGGIQYLGIVGIIIVMVIITIVYVFFNGLPAKMTRREKEMCNEEKRTHYKV